MPIHLGLGDVDGTRRLLVRAIDDCTPLLSLAASFGPFIGPLRADAEIDRLVTAALGW